MKNFHAIGLSLAAMSLVAAPIAAQESNEVEVDDYFGLESAEKVDFATLRCWDVVTLSEDDRAFAMVLLYGYARGEMGDGNASPRDVQTAVVNTMMECVDTPDATVLDVLKTHIRLD